MLNKKGEKRLIRPYAGYSSSEIFPQAASMTKFPRPATCSGCLLHLPTRHPQPLPAASETVAALSYSLLRPKNVAPSKHVLPGDQFWSIRTTIFLNDKTQS